MRRFVFVVIAVVSLSMIGVAAAGTGGNKTGQACYKGAYANYVDPATGRAFASQSACVSYVANGGTLQPKPPCTAGSENFSEDAEFSKPTTFAGGTIDGPYGSEPSVEGGVFVQGTSFFGGFANGAHVVYGGLGVTSFKLTFTNPVGSVALDAQAVQDRGEATTTLTAYDASNNVLGDDQVSGTALGVTTLTVASVTNNIKYFTIAATDENSLGVAFTNLVWGCN